METELEAEKTDLANKENHHNECIKKVSDLERTINEHGRDRETRLKDVEKNIKSTKKEMTAASKDLKVLHNRSLVLSSRKRSDNSVSSCSVTYRISFISCDCFVTKWLKEDLPFSSQEQEGARERLVMEREAGLQEIQGLEGQLVTAHAQIKKMEEELAQLETEVTTTVSVSVAESWCYFVSFLASNCIAPRI